MGRSFPSKVEIKAISLGVPILVADKVASKAALLTVVVHPQWSQVSELMIVHLWRQICVRWAPNGTMDQPLGMLVAGQSAPKKNQLFFLLLGPFFAPRIQFSQTKRRR